MTLWQRFTYWRQSLGWTILSRRHYREMRAALQDACQSCHTCKGRGRVAMPGTSLRCPRCGWWRQLIQLGHGRNRGT